MKNTYCVIMAGGVGSRFWPMSRTNKPKQFLDILGTGETLLQATYRRFLKICPRENIVVVTNEAYKSHVEKQLPDISGQQILLESARKNTAPCISYAVNKIGKINQDATIIVTPADHLITREDDFVTAINSCIRKARLKDCLLTIGIKPSRPDTGYGYIQYLDDNVCEFDNKIKPVKTFTEKPNLELAKSFLESGDFLWNAGIFVFSYSSIKKAFKQHLPEVDNIFEDGKDKYFTDQEEDFIKNAYLISPNISIDYGLMEKASNVYVRASVIGWSDLGTWGSMFEQMPKNAEKNSISGKNVMLYNTKNSLVKTPNEKLVVIEGLENYIVVENDGMLLICSMENEQLIKTMVNDIQAQKGEKYI